MFQGTVKGVYRKFKGCVKDIGNLKSIQILQNRAAQISTHSPPRAQRAPMCDHLQWLTVNQLVFYHTVLTIFKIRSKREPEHLSEIE